MKGLPNIGSTCWLNALVQCLRVTRKWPQPDSTMTTDAFTLTLMKLLREETDDTSEFLNELPIDPFGSGPNDSQEALLYILDRLERTINMTSFTGEVTQTVIFPGGRSVTKTPCTVWFKNNEHEDTITNYTDSHGNTHNVAVIQRALTKIPDVLVSDIVQDDLFEKKLIGIVHWGFGHYTAYVKDSNGDWWSANDSHVAKASPILRGYIAFYK